jgi:hypothetical protein
VTNPLRPWRPEDFDERRETCGAPAGQLREPRFYPHVAEDFMSLRVCRKGRQRPIPFDCKLGAVHGGECSPFTHRPVPPKNPDDHAALLAMSRGDAQQATSRSSESVPLVAELAFPTVSVVHIWLHRPTGAAGASAVWRLPDGGPTAGHGTRFLSPTNSVPHGAEDLWSARTTADVESALARLGWVTVSRATAARRLIGAFQLPAVRRAGHILQASEPDDVVWQVSEFEAVAFAVHSRSLDSQQTVV